MLRWLIGILVVVIAAYYLLHGVLPWLQGSAAGPEPSPTGSPAASGAAACVDAASDAYDAVVGAANSLGPPPIDSRQWSSLVMDLGGPLGRADRACGCAAPACDTASQAVRELRGLLSLYDGMSRSDLVGNPASYIERASNLLDRARAEAR